MGLVIINNIFLWMFMSFFFSLDEDPVQSVSIHWWLDIWLGAVGVVTNSYRSQGTTVSLSSSYAYFCHSKVSHRLLGGI